MSSLTDTLQSFRNHFPQTTQRLLLMIGIPVALYGLMVALSWLSISIVKDWYISFAWILGIILAIRYYFYDLKLASTMTVVLFIFALVATVTGYPKPSPSSIVIFLIFFLGGLALLFIAFTMNKEKKLIIPNIKHIIFMPLYFTIECLVYFGAGSRFGLESKPTKSAQSMVENKVDSLNQKNNSDEIDKSSTNTQSDKKH